ncbi:TetR-like C-terminal domain-containing protein [Streptomyces lydicus]|uniref:TetR-like C-terminal domain-containing protein n=1 Tax=Streptomyces lydicus TaxID=47763 RepID=UPI003798B14A
MAGERSGIPAGCSRAGPPGGVLGRAVDRGEVEPELLTERIKSLPFDLLRHEILTTFAPVPEHVLEEIVDTVFLRLVR